MTGNPYYIVQTQKGKNLTLCTDPAVACKFALGYLRHYPEGVEVLRCDGTTQTLHALFNDTAQGGSHRTH